MTFRMEQFGLDQTRVTIASLVFLSSNAVVFGIGIIAVLAIEPLASHAMILIPAVVVASFVLGAPAAWFIAPRLRARYWRTREDRQVA